MINVSALFAYTYETDAERVALLAKIPPLAVVVENEALKQITYTSAQYDITLGDVT